MDDPKEGGLLTSVNFKMRPDYLPALAEFLLRCVFIFVVFNINVYIRLNDFYASSMPMQ